jgi:capsid assembly protease
MRNPALFARIFNTPLLVHPAKLDAIIAGLGPRFGVDLAPTLPEAFLTQTGERRRPGYSVAHGVATIDVFGVLAHRGGMQADSSYVLGYDAIAKRLDAAMNDADVKAILMQFDTPGGEVAGAFDLAAMIHSAAQQKPIRAVVSDLAASAGYLLASAASDIATSDTGYTGSIGVVMRHVDVSAALAKEGVRVTHIYAGAHKIDGNPYETLPEAVQTQLQAEVDALRGTFADAVGRYRGTRMDAAAALATEAAIYRGGAAIQAGLADRIAAPDQVLSDMQSQYSKRSSAKSTPRGKSMSTENPDAVFAQSDIDRARAEGHAEGLKAGIEQGTTAERERVNGILSHAEAEGRTTQALALVEAGLTVEQAGKVLAKSPKEQTGAATQVGSFAQHMAALGNPPIGADSDGRSQSEEDAAIDRAWARAFGRGANA